MPTYNLGLDVHKVRTQYCLMDPAGKILGEGNVPTEAVAGLVPGADCAVVLEATGSWHAAYDALCAAAEALADDCNDHWREGDPERLRRRLAAVAAGLELLAALGPPPAR